MCDRVGALNRSSPATTCCKRNATVSRCDRSSFSPPSTRRSLPTPPVPAVHCRLCDGCGDSVCVWVCLCDGVCACARGCARPSAHVCIYTCVRVYVVCVCVRSTGAFVCVQALICVCVYVCVCVCVCVSVCLCLSLSVSVFESELV